MRNLKCAKENRRCSIQGHGRISHICYGGYEGQSCICGEYNELIYVKGRLTILDGHKTHHEVFKKHFRLQIIWREGYCFEKILRCELDKRYKRLAIHNKVCVFFVGVGIISWKCKKQPTIALSTMKVKYMAIA